ncbi:MAG TPA: NAD-dependent malic enzyme [Nitriliruptorales bacterium]|nr:NAD-dependent malic enzyme [Nitriliruptorales bacterium]
MPATQHRVTIRVALENVPGMLGRVTGTVEEHAGMVTSIDAVRAQRHVVVRDVTVEVRDDAHGEELAVALDRLDGVELLALTDDVVRAHLGGKIRVENRRPVGDREDLSLVYTPGVGRICQMIAENPTEAYRLTIKSNAVAVVTDGSAVLGLGDIGPLASLPVMEGKAMLFKEFGAVDAYPVLVNEQDPDTFVDTVARIAVGFGGINLEDIASPRCFEIEGKLRQRLDIPVFHDDQHGTAVVVLAALLNAVRLVGKELADLRLVLQGAGAAGVAVANLLMAAGVEDIVALDRSGILTMKRGRNDPIKRRLAKQTNPRGLEGELADAMEGADVFVGLSGPRTLPVELLKTMAPRPIVFALANPVPEIMPEDARPYVSIMATGRSDYPNQINNVLAFPGIFRGLLDAAATQVSDEMKVAAAHAIAAIVGDEASEDYIIPSPFDRSVAPAVAEAVARTAREQGLVRPGSYGSLQEELDARAHEAAKRALARAYERLGTSDEDTTSS